MTSEIRVVQRVNASAAHLWRACTSARGLAGWQADQVEGAVEPGSSLVLRWPELSAEMRLEVTELVEMRRISFRAGHEVVRLEVEPGSVVLTHHGLGSTDEALGTASSWRVSLATLAHGLERHPGRDRRVHWRLTRAKGSAEAIHVFFTDPHALGAWLTTEGGIGGPGQPVEMRLADRARLTGRVLANTPGRDVAISWSEDGESALALRTLPGIAEGERLIAVQWSRWAEAQFRVGFGGFETALRRLRDVLNSAASA